MKRLLPAILAIATMFLFISLMVNDKAMGSSANFAGNASFGGDVGGPHDISGDANLVGVWYFENDATDETASTNDLTESGTVAYITESPTPKQGTYAIDFDDNEYVYIDGGDQTNMDATSGLTFGGWYYFDFVVFFNFMGNMMTDGSNRSWGFLADTNGAIEFYISPDGSTVDSFASANSIATADTWDHWAVTYETDTITLYRNGSPLVSGDFPATYTTDIFNNSHRFWIAGDSFGNDLNGKVDEVFYAIDGMSGSEVSNIFNNGFTP